ncbi:MAG TPA: asparaginase domain-containing protein [Candidatus Saccharimonadales bacterium]|nr:asparaginase domain-containing protein [Candidatus Saccharimonadales bacterium]
MSEKIALVGFGGTIAMAPNEHGALAPALSADDLVKSAPGLAKLDVELDVLQLSDVDSSDLAPNDWSLLSQNIADLHQNYDGVLVTHGTDTMPYTGTAVSMALGSELSIPIVFTGSQQDVSKVGNDVQTNLERSMLILQEAAKQGVSETMIVFSKRAMRAARTVKESGSDYDAFYSPGFENLATLSASDTVKFSPLAIRKDNLGLPISLRDSFDDGVVTVDVKPGLRAETVRLMTSANSCRGIIMSALGSGNIPTRNPEYSLLPVVEEAVAAGKPVILTTKFEGEETTPASYELGRQALEAGAGHSGNMTSVAATVKLMWLLGQGMTDPEKINNAMLLSRVGEVD